MSAKKFIYSTQEQAENNRFGWGMSTSPKGPQSLPEDFSLGEAMFKESSQADGCPIWKKLTYWKKYFLLLHYYYCRRRRRLYQPSWKDWSPFVWFTLLLPGIYWRRLNMFQVREMLTSFWLSWHTIRDSNETWITLLLTCSTSRTWAVRCSLLKSKSSGRAQTIVLLTIAVSRIVQGSAVCAIRRT